MDWDKLEIFPTLTQEREWEEKEDDLFVVSARVEGQKSFISSIRER